MLTIRTANKIKRQHACYECRPRAVSVGHGVGDKTAVGMTHVPYSAVLCSDVFTILQEIQRTWSYLEPLFIGSEEVKKELPEDAKRFEIIDTDVKELLKSVSRHTWLQAR